MKQIAGINLKRPPDSEMCAPGYHIVHAHERICKSGTTTWVRRHLCKNRGKILELHKENLLYLFWNSDKTFLPLKKIKGFKNDNGQLDSVIQFWLNYWQSQGLNVSDVDPLLVKTLIAIESSFNLKASSKIRGSSAYGLMQVTDQARRIMSGDPDSKGYREIRSNNVAVSKDDVADPVTNIAAGIRWLSHKQSQIPKGNVKNVFNMIKNYHSWDKDGENYARSVVGLYDQSK